MRTEKKHQLAKLRHWRVRKKVRGTSERPRMSVRFTNEHIYVQFIDDVVGRTLASASTRAKDTPDRENLAANVAGAKVVGRLAAETALARGIKSVVFDRGGDRYHWSKGKEEKGKETPPALGKLAALADAARQAGLQF
jgi:large subunit ribosomal protein L18